MDVRRFLDARTFLDRAERWLLREEAENGLFLGIATSLLGPHRFGSPVYLATVEEGDEEVLGCALRTPPYHAIVSRMPATAAEPLADDLGTVYDTLPGVQGRPAEAEAVAAAWCARTGQRPVLGFQLRLHVLTDVILPIPMAPGRLRVAEPTDLAFVTGWAAGFVRDTGVDTRPEEFGEHLLRSGGLYLWEDRIPRSMVGINRTSANGATIGAVYTPPEFRGRGYASAAVAELSQRLLDAGRRFCTLYTDVANPTSNKIYRALGFKPVADNVLIRFE